MNTFKQVAMFRKVDELELRACMYLNRHCRKEFVKHYFRVVSRLGDGVAWYALMCMLPLFYGKTGFVVGIAMGMAALLNVWLYKRLKQIFVRERPYISYDGIEAGTRALDRYSFPSGHTLHAVCFTVICVYFFPVWGVLLIPLMLSIASSRLVLGLHYPTDVLVGALLGALIGSSVIGFIITTII